MPADDNALISLGLNDHPPVAPIPAAEQLQFRRAEPAPGTSPHAPERACCVACGQFISDQYFHAQGRVVCPTCAVRIQAGQQARPSVSLLRAALYGGAAGLVGCALYALVAIIGKMQIALIAILVGIMVGKAIRYASKGMGGRAQQILAVTLTYFSITTSYIPVFFYHFAQSRPKQMQPLPERRVMPAPSADPQATVIIPQTRPRPRISIGRALAVIFGAAAIAPFLILFHSPVSGVISLFIIFIGLQRAWVLTGRPDILVLGPYRIGDAAPV